MTILIILLILAVLGFYFAFNDEYIGTVFNLIGIIFVLIFGIIFLIYATGMILSSYEYEKINTKRQSIQRSIDVARQTPNSFELASVTRDVIDFNKELEWQQRQNSFWLCDPLIDDRINNLKPIQ